MMKRIANWLRNSAGRSPRGDGTAPVHEERVMMNGTKTKPEMQDQQLSCYRLWMKPKTAKKNEKRTHPILGQYLLGIKK
jgi:hypothetical protein